MAGRAVRVAALAVMVASTAVGCGFFSGNDTGETVNQDQTLERAIAHYHGFEQDVFEALSGELGPREWAPASPDGPVHALCDGGETASLPPYSFAGSYPQADWHRAGDVVARTAAEYGFGNPEVVVDGPEDYEIEARNDSGAKYTFGVGANTVFAVTTGCHPVG